jgi:hypothetical protein
VTPVTKVRPERALTGLIIVILFLAGCGSGG